MRKITTSLFLIFSLAANIIFAREITGPAAHQKISGADKIIEGTHSLVPAYVQFRKDAQPGLTDFSQWAHSAFRIPAAYDFSLINIASDGIGMTHTRYRQMLNGYPVEGTMVIAHSQNGKIVSVNGMLFNKITAGSATLGEPAALSNALGYMNADVYRWEIPFWQQQLKNETKNPQATWYPEGELVYAPVNGNFNDGSYRLAYRFDVYAEKPLKREYVYVDAVTGNVIYTQNRIHHTDVLAMAVTGYSGNREITTDSVNTTTYRLRESGRGNGIETYNLQQGTNYNNTDFLDTDNFWDNVNAAEDEYATDAHWGAEMTYDFFMLNFGLNSYDGAGTTLLSYVHYDVGYLNAFWDGQRMTYGDGSGGYTPLTSIEIAGHEISHGVTEFSSNLIYANESGGLNEAFSDCMGNAIRHYGKGTGAINWFIGDEIGGTPFRSMSDPNQYQNPDTYGGLYWYAPNEVHNNSGVMNYWFYLLTEGGTGTNDIGNVYSVTGQGITVAQAVCYRMNAVYLVPSSDYADARTYAIQSAIDLYGPCTPEVEATADAWHAVGIGNAFTPGVTADFTAPLVTFCNVPATVDFSNLSSNAGYYVWDFGDGDTSHANSPSHTYTTFGDFTVSLIADGGSCGIDTIIQVQFISVDTINPCIVSLPTNGSATTQTTCSGQLFDSGGPAANYTDNTDSRITISPIGASTVTLTFTSFGFETDFDYLYIYDGPTIGSPLIGQYDGFALPNGGTITSTGGSITLRQTTDQNITESGFALTWDCFLSTVPPTANFDASTTNTCSGNVQFNDLSSNGPVSWSWDFGDGGTSTQQNPQHTYIANGTYTVILIVTNANGSDTLTMTNYITVALPAAPSGTGASGCQGSFAPLTATGAGVLTWFDVASGGTALGTGATFNTPPLTANTTYYVESDIYPASEFNGPVDNSFGTGGYFANTTDRHLIFDCYQTCRLLSVWVDAQSSGNRTVELRNSGGLVLQSATINIPAGQSRITLNFDLPIGTDMHLAIGGNADLYRNNGGAVFPYTLSGLVSITGTNASLSGYYYYFYDWEIQGPPCVSPRTPVLATMIPGPNAAYSFNINDNIVDFTDLSTGGVIGYAWDFGDPASGAANTSTLQNPTHAFTAIGGFTVCLTATNSSNCQNTLCQTINILTVDLPEGIHTSGISVFPNPVNDQLTINFNSDQVKWNLKLMDIVGQLIDEKTNSLSTFKWDLSSIAPGSYLLVMQSEGQTLMTRIVKQ